MLKITTTTPAALLAAIKKAIDDGHIVTWSYDKDGDFTHTPQQWKNEAWLTPTTTATELQLRIIQPKDTTITKEVNGVYHGRFIEMLLAHFDTKFTSACAIP